MNFQKFTSEFKKKPGLEKAGMILFHNGIVRSTSRNGKDVTGLSVMADESRLEAVLEKYRNRPGIVAVSAIINSAAELKTGDDIMYMAIAGDVRENVIRTLEDCLDEIKSAVTVKTEFYV